MEVPPKLIVRQANVSAREKFFGFYLRIRAVYRVLVALRYVRNKLPAIGHIVNPENQSSFVYELPHRIRMFVGNAKADRTALFSVKEIFGDKVYNMPGCEDSRIIVDLGANVGVYSLWAAFEYPSAKIYAVEAGADNAQYLKQSISLSSLGERLYLTHAAVWKTDGELTLFRSDITSRAHSVVRANDLDGHGGSETVPALTLKRLFETNRIETCDLLKVDIEGAEYDVLYNSPPEVMNKIKAIILEHHRDARPECNFNGLSKFLRASGFRNVQSRFQFESGDGILAATR
jgi:FkbM family methyltransferase